MNKIGIVLIVIIYLIFSHFVNNYINNIGKDYYPDESRLYDISQYLPNYAKYEIIGNFYIGFVSLLLLFKPNIIFDFVSFIIPIFFIRNILTMITILPKSSDCNHHSCAFINGGCYDKIFSGHTAYIFILTLLLNKNKIINFSTLILINIINVFIILTTRTHYTIDVLVSFLVCYVMYKNNIRL